jgi:hypothetical protein
MDFLSTLVEFVLAADLKKRALIGVGAVFGAEAIVMQHT